MGWLDNLENELSGQAGPSGLNQGDPIEQTQVVSFQLITSDPENLNFESENVQILVKEKTALNIFAERVTIAGLLEACTAELLAERRMFRIGLLVAFAMIIYQSIGNTEQYQTKDTIFVDFEVSERAPFPNVTVCFAPAANSTLMQEFVFSRYGDCLTKLLNEPDIGRMNWSLSRMLPFPWT